MAEENVTTKFRVDISDLKKGIADANRQIKSLSAQMKNANAGMEKGEETVDSLTKKIQAQQQIVEQEKTKLAALKEELARYNAKVQDGDRVIAELTQKQREAADAYGETSDEAKRYAAQLSAAVQAQERNRVAAQNLNTQIINQDTSVRNAEAQVGRFQNALNSLEAEMSQTENATDDVNDSLDDTSDELKKVDKESEKTTNGGLNTFAVALGNLAANVIAKVLDSMKELVTSTIEVGKNFDSSMSNVKAISGATGEEVDILTQKAQELGKNTSKTAQEVADGFGYMAMAGWKTEDMLGGINGVVRLSEAAQTDLATASDIVTDALTAFGEGADQAGRLADIMASASSNANTNVELMGETFKYVAPLAGSMGYSMEDTAVAIGLMANAGIKGSQAGTSLRSIITRMASPTKESAMAMSELGISITKTGEDGQETTKSLSELMMDMRDAFGQAKIPMEELTAGLSELEQRQANYDDMLANGEITQKQYDKALKTLNDEESTLMERAYGAEGALKAQYAAQIAGKNSLSGLLAIINASDSDFNKLTDAINNSSGAAEAMSETMLDNLGGDMTLLSSAFEGFQMSLYNNVSSPLRELVGGVKDDVMPALESIVNGEEGGAQKLGEAIGKLISKVLRYITDAIPTIVDAILPVGEAISETLIDMIPDFLESGSKILSSLIKSFTKQLPKIVQQISKLVSNKKNIEIIVKAITSNIPILVKGAVNLLMAIVDAIPIIIDALLPQVPYIVVAIVEALIKSVPTLVVGVVKAVDMLIDELPAIFYAIGETVFNLISEFSTRLWTPFKELWTSGFADIEEAWSIGWSAIVEGAQSALDVIIGIWESIVGKFSEIWSGIKSVFASVGSFFTSTFTSGFNNAKNAFKSAKNEFSKIWTNIKSAFSSVGEWFKTTFTTAWTNVKSAFSSVGEFFGGIWDTIKEKFTDIGAKVGESVSAAFKSTINAVLQTVEDHLNAIPDAINSAIDILNKIPAVDIGHLDYFSLPRLAKGGIVDKSTLANIGEDGREAIIPLEKNKGGLKEIANLLAQEMYGNGFFGGIPKGGDTVYNFTQNNTSPKALSRYEIYRQTKNLISAAKGVM